MAGETLTSISRLYLMLEFVVLQGPVGVEYPNFPQWNPEWKINYREEGKLFPPPQKANIKPLLKQILSYPQKANLDVTQVNNITNLMSYLSYTAIIITKIFRKRSFSISGFCCWFCVISFNLFSFFISYGTSIQERKKGWIKSNTYADLVPTDWYQ